MAQTPTTPPPRSPSDVDAWFVTFGFGQPLESCWAWIPGAVSREQAYVKVILVYGERWSFIYGREEYDSAVLRYQMREVEFGTPND